MPDPNVDEPLPVPVPEQPPMDDAAGGPQADDDEDDSAKPHTPVTD